MLQQNLLPVYKYSTGTYVRSGCGRRQNWAVGRLSVTEYSCMYIHTDIPVHVYILKVLAHITSKKIYQKEIPEKEKQVINLTKHVHMYVHKYRVSRYIHT